MAIRNLQFILSGKDKDASRTLGKVGQKADGLSSKLGGIGKSMSAGLAGGAVAVGAGLGAALAAGIKGASDLAESTSKVNTVFGESSIVIRDFANGAARDLGMTKQAALEATGTFGNLFGALGIGMGPAAEMSTKLTTLATDLGSFNNVDSADALLALRSGLLGEAEPLRAFGVSLSAARIEAEALRLGLVQNAKDEGKITAARNKVEAATNKATAASKKYGKDSLQARTATDARVRAEETLAAAMRGTKVDLTAAQKAQAAYAIIMKDTKVAQGDFARTSGGLANQTKILKAQLSDTATSIGTKLLPYITDMATFLNDRAVPAVQRFIDQFQRGVGRGGEFRDFLEDVGNKARDMWPHVQTAFEWTKKIVDFVVEHKDAFVTIAAGVASYAKAMQAAQLAAGLMGANGPKAAAGIAATGGAAGANAGKVGAFATALGRVAGVAGILAGLYLTEDKDGPVRKAFDEIASGVKKIFGGDIGGGLQDVFIGDNAPQWLGGDGRKPKPAPKVIPPRVDVDERGRYHGNVPAAGRGTGGRGGNNLTVNNNLHLDGKPIARSTQTIVQQKSARGLIYATP